MSFFRSTRLLRTSTPRSHFHASAYRWAGRKVLKHFKLADIGEGITECEVIKWSVHPLKAVEAFDALCEVQSDKASVEITSPFEGIVKELIVKEGEVAKVGATLCTIEVDEEVLADTDVNSKESADASLHLQQPPSHYGFTAASPQVASRDEIQKPISERRPHPLDPNVPQMLSLSGSSHSHDILAMPSVRHFAMQNNVDLSNLAPGSGKGGRIEMHDVQAHLSGSSTTDSAGGNKKYVNTPGSANSSSDVIVPLGRIRYGMWKAMVKSLEIPHFGYSSSLDLTTLHEFLPILNMHIPSRYLSPSSILASTPAVSPSVLHPPPVMPQIHPSGQYSRITYLPILLKTLSKAMLEWPLFRSSITPGPSIPNDKPTLTIRPYADISIALSTPTGLFTPTIQHVDTHSVYSLASQLKHIAHLGRQTPCGLTPADMPKRGGTVTVSNIGGIGAGEYASPVLVPGGGVAIVAIGRAHWVWDVERGDGRGERRLKVGISWSADHRVIEGAELVGMIECWRSWVEAPQRLIGEGI